MRDKLSEQALTPNQHVLHSIKIMLVAIVAAFFSLVSYTNMVDYQSNWQFVQHVLAMDTTFHSAAIMSRSISNPTMQMVTYWSIIFLELLAALFCWVGAITLFRNRRDKEQFIQAKLIANIGLAIGLFLYLFCFVIVAGEWFVMWQSKQWNAQQTAIHFATILFMSIIFLNQE